MSGKKLKDENTEEAQAQSKKKIVFGQPGVLARIRFTVGGSWPAAALLYRLKFHLGNEKKGLERKGRRWIAMSRKDWAREAGLSEGELKNSALPILKNEPYFLAQQWKLKYNSQKLLWLTIEEGGIPEPEWHLILADEWEVKKGMPHGYGGESVVSLH